MKSFIRAVGPLILVAGIGWVCFYLWQGQHRAEAPAPPQPVQIPTAVQAEAAPPPAQYPVTAESEKPQSFAVAAVQSPVPQLDESDPSLESALIALYGKDRIEALFDVKNLVRRVVATVDAGTGHKQPGADMSPFKAPKGDFRVSGTGDETQLDPANFQRYTPYVDLLRGVDIAELVGVYRHFYPLFQAAYRELGTQGYFNDRVVKVIDNILATPDVSEPIRLLQPTPLSKYKYADEKLESLSVAQKIMIRMGSENAKTIKARLREIRTRIIQLK